MSSSNESNDFKVTVKSPPKDGRVSPTFKVKKLEGLEKVGKHGKSHH